MLSMDDALLTTLLERLDAQPLADGAIRLLLAACEGEAALDAELGSPSPSAPPQLSDVSPGGTGEPAGAYLRQVTVTGFRGIGPSATLPVTPGPGLTVIHGRNGSGKSSFAEALEVLLTGDLKRWEKLSAIWHEGWRNLRTAEPAEISAEFLIEGSGPADVKRTWTAEAGFDGSRIAVQAHGEREAGMERLGWQDALRTYRPFLSHAELEAFFREPSHVYDLLSEVLGLEPLTTSVACLAAARKQREMAVTETSRALPALLDQVRAVEDERAAACAQALSTRRPDLQQVRLAAAGAATGTSSGEIDRLRRLSQLILPPEDQVHGVLKALREAAYTLDEQTGSRAGRASTLAALLRSTLDHYQAHGTGDCPVCGQSAALNETWRASTEQAVASLTAEAAAADAAQVQAQAVRSRARALLSPPPGALDGPPVAGVAIHQAASAWTAWARWPDDDLRKIASHIEQTWPRLQAAVTALTGQAQAALRSREDRWAPVAARVTAWCQQALDAHAAAQPVPALKAAESWLKKGADDIRNARLEPLAEHSRAVWANLRQESDIDLGSIRLSGSNTRRQADVSVIVDGAPGAALGVMSQGEINALALSIFLPRATLPASPFRFLVIDDPVQAMDPAKVDGLARVLEEVSRTRQVLVFTHDDRLSDAIRRMQIDAHILEVTRRPGSVVTVRPALTPVRRQLEDAWALSMDAQVPENVARQVVPGLCRTAAEAAFTEAILRRQLRAGRRHAEVDQDIIAASRGMRQLAALALYGDASKTSLDVIRRISTWHSDAGETYRALNRAAHEGYDGDLRDLVSQTRRLADLIQRQLP
jgi:recombinational DNA repair ATPase RecF